MRFEGKLAVVTGGAGAFGRACAYRLLQEGARVVLLDKQQIVLEAARSLNAEIAPHQAIESPPPCKAFVCDVADEAEVIRILEEIVEVTEGCEGGRGGRERSGGGRRIDMVFNNAGIQGEFKPLMEYDSKAFVEILNVNIMGAFHIIKHAAKYMKRPLPCTDPLPSPPLSSSCLSSSPPSTSSPPPLCPSSAPSSSVTLPSDKTSSSNRISYGVIVNTSSCAALNGQPNMCAYSASKAAVTNLTKTAAKELALEGIRVCSISPGYIGDCDMWYRQVNLQAEAASRAHRKETDVVRNDKGLKSSVFFDEDPHVVAAKMVEETWMKRTGAVEEVVSVACFLMSDEASYLTGVDIPVAGGAS